MKLWQSIPVIFALLIVLCICLMIIVRDNKRYKFISSGEVTFGEDLFQNECKEKGINESAIIIALFTFNILDKDRLKKVIDNICKDTQYFVEDYFRRYKYLYVSMKDKNFIKENDKDDILTNINTEKNPIPLILIYSYSTQQILIIMDHTYIGGYFFQEWGTVIFKGDQIAPYLLKYQPIITELNSIRFLLCDIMPSHISGRKNLTVLSDRNKITRVSIKYDIKLLAKKLGVPPKVSLIYTFSQLLFKYMNLNRSIKVIVPMAFKNDNYAYNNVGAIMLNINSTDSVTDIIKKLNKKQYHAYATNHLMQIINKGKDARSKIDAVFTIGYIKKSELVEKEEMTSVQITYPGY